MKALFEFADVIVGHNIIRWDVPNLERVLGIKIKCKLVDTLALSWALEPSRKRHGLEWWGEEFGVPKPKIKSWDNLPLEDYVHRCQEDVKINTKLWKRLWRKMKLMYKTDEQVWKYIDYIMFKMNCALLAEKSGWHVDVKYCEENLVKLVEVQKEKVAALTAVMPPVPVKEKKSQPKRLTNKNGELTKFGQTWYDLLASQNLPADTTETEVVKEWNPGNPNAPGQVKDWLFSLGWVPRTFKYDKDKDGKPKETPQINLEHGKGICESIKELYEKEPALEHLDGLSILNHRIPILAKLLSMRDKDDKVQAKVNGLTNTLRFQHADPCVNLPKPERAYAEPVRGSFISPSGYKLVGADMSSLEDRLKQHYIFPLDPTYVQSMMSKDFDPHLALAVMAGMITQSECDWYKVTDSLEDDKKKNLDLAEKNKYKELKTIRGIAKSGNYACQYGAYPPKLSKTCGITIERAQQLFDGYWKLNWAIKEVASRQKIITVDGEMWLLNPISGFYYSLRKKNDIFSTLIQGTASYVFDLWVENILKVRPQLTAQFHDEVVLLVREENVTRLSDLCHEALRETNEHLKLNRELGIGVQVGDRYSQIH